jgi:hypothetical protein
LFGLQRTNFVLGNVEAYYNGEEEPPFQGSFDLVCCLGFLYHVPDPGKALSWFRAQGKTLFLGTHLPTNDGGADEDYEFNGKSYRVQRYDERGYDDRIAGMSAISRKPYEPDLLQMLHDAGFAHVSVLGHDLHYLYPHVTLLAE